MIRDAHDRLAKLIFDQLTLGSADANYEGRHIEMVGLLPVVAADARSRQQFGEALKARCADGNTFPVGELAGILIQVINDEIADLELTIEERETRVWDKVIRSGSTGTGFAGLAAILYAKADVLTGGLVSAASAAIYGGAAFRSGQRTKATRPLKTSLSDLKSLKEMLSRL